jgi:hypothetical protein
MQRIVIQWNMIHPAGHYEVKIMWKADYSIESDNHHVSVQDRQFIWCKNTISYFLLKNKKEQLHDGSNYMHK